jgi:hypothetical protein
MLDTMRAERFYADSKTIAVEDIPIPVPGPGEVLVKVAFCGVCHSDVSLINGTFPPISQAIRQDRQKVYSDFSVSMFNLIQHFGNLSGTPTT